MAAVKSAAEVDDPLSASLTRKIFGYKSHVAGTGDNRLFNANVHVLGPNLNAKRQRHCPPLNRHDVALDAHRHHHVGGKKNGYSSKSRKASTSLADAARAPVYITYISNMNIFSWPCIPGEK